MAQPCTFERVKIHFNRLFGASGRSSLTYRKYTLVGREITLLCSPTVQLCATYAGAIGKLSSLFLVWSRIPFISLKYPVFPYYIEIYSGNGGIDQKWFLGRALTITISIWQYTFFIAWRDRWTLHCSSQVQASSLTRKLPFQRLYVGLLLHADLD